MTKKERLLDMLRIVIENPSTDTIKITIKPNKCSKDKEDKKK